MTRASHMQNRIYSFFCAKKTSSDYSAVFRVAVPVVVGTIIKLSETEVAELLTYKNKEKCDAEFSLEPFRAINHFENVIIKKAGLFEPEAATIFVGAVIAGLLIEAQQGNPLNYLCRAGQKMLNQIKYFALSLTKKDLTYVVTMIAGALATELSDKYIKNEYGFNSSGHFKTAITFELLNSLTLRVIQRIENQREEEVHARQTYAKSANAVLWLNSLLAAISLSLTASECHSLEEVASGIGVGILLHTASILLSNGIDMLCNCYASTSAVQNEGMSLLNNESRALSIVTPDLESRSISISGRVK